MLDVDWVSAVCVNGTCMRVEMNTFTLRKRGDSVQLFWAL